MGCPMSYEAYDNLAGLFEGPVKARRAHPGDVVARVRRVINHVPEVMVKISGNAKGAEHLKSHMDYISRNGQLELETETGEIIQGKDVVKQLHQSWLQDPGKRRANTRDSTNIVLSMPKGTPVKALKEAVSVFAKKQFGENHQYVMALHTDADHPHVHLVVKALGFDGKRLHIKKGEPQMWRETFAKELRQQGIEAEATPRAVRGVVKKSVSQVIKHLKDRGIMPNVDKARAQAVYDELKTGKGILKPEPWEITIRNRRDKVKKSWVSAAKILSASEVYAETRFADKIFKFVQEMPKMRTLRYETAIKMVEMFKRQQAEKAGAQPQRRQRSRNLERDDGYER